MELRYYAMNVQTLKKEFSAIENGDAVVFVLHNYLLRTICKEG